jgi:hypothetical protein
LYTGFQVGEKARQVDESDAFATLTFADHGAFDVTGVGQFEQRRATQTPESFSGLGHPNPVFNVIRHRGRQ